MSSWRSLLVSLLCLLLVVINIYLTLQRGQPAGKGSTVDDTGIAAILSAILAVVVPLYSFIRAEERFRESEGQRLERESNESRQRLLRAALSRIFEGEDLTTVRANLMIVSDDVLTILCSVNMEFYPDNEIELGYGQGCAGIAWKRAREAPASVKWTPVLALKEQLSNDSLREEWGLAEDQIEKTKHLLWILSTPVFYSPSGESKFIGVLNFDGVNRPLNNMHRLEEAATHRNCADIAEGLGTELVRNNLVPLP